MKWTTEWTVTCAANLALHFSVSTLAYVNSFSTLFHIRVFWRFPVLCVCFGSDSKKSLKKLYSACLLSQTTRIKSENWMPEPEQKNNFISPFTAPQFRDTFALRDSIWGLIVLFPHHFSLNAFYHGVVILTTNVFLLLFLWCCKINRKPVSSINDLWLP